MRFPFSLLGLAAQLPLNSLPPETPKDVTIMTAVANGQTEFQFKESPEIFSPKDLVELARPGSGSANDVGDLVLVPVSKYSFEDKKNNKFIYIASVESTIKPLEIPLANGGQAFWLDSRTIGHVTSASEGKPQELYAISVKYEADTDAFDVPPPPALVGAFPTGTSPSNFRYSAKAGQLVFSDYVYEDGNLTAVKEHDEAWEKRGTTALVYDDTFVRHWDTWKVPKKNTLLSVTLVQDSDLNWVLGDVFFNALKGTGHSAPVEPFGGTDDFDVWQDLIVYTTKDPKLPPAWHTKQNVYIIDTKGEKKPKELTSGKQGATHSPVFSKSGDKVAWLELDADGYEADRAKIVIYDLIANIRFTLTQQWDRSPDALAFSPAGDYLYLTAGDHARIKVFVIPVPPTPSKSSTHPVLPPQYLTPLALTESGAAGGVQVLPGGRVLFTSSSLTGPNDVFVIKGLRKEDGFDMHHQASPKSTISANVKITQITKFTEDALKGKNLSVGEEFWFKGANDKNVQGWIVKPPGFKEGEKKKWPVLLLIHGGPQGAWEDQWSTRWNPNVFAQQGYFVVAINPTGSTTFGQEFTDAIAEDWGGKPFIDMQKGWKYVLDTYPEIDTERAVAAGASWGGYAINWIEGHPEYGFGFKALVSHDGVFDSNYNGYSTDELFFFNHEWGGRPWDAKSKALSNKYSPSNFVDKWGTPMLLIHGSKDYRLPETESIGAFHALQQKGIKSRLVIFPNENHWVLDHGNSLKWHYEVFRWFDEFVGKD
ncbi:hypothetical protein JAAARDRAFT_30397 [Jaapia argillacea MUCL 33604]|uniref:Dipeptidyl-peptidase V n=1 Tax=Jaapia argillacea MUCL 33604 TaxID=933084 RepID=A0A067Q6B9_9AGAM|nr:hypothetical protein JAAARDRAFT_30397 [Jaapia argillacea MUCL 33604]